MNRKLKIRKIKSTIVHYIGSYNLNEGLRFSNELTNISKISKYLSSVISSSFNVEDLYKFNNLSENTVYEAIKNIFDDPKTFIGNSKLLAKTLYHAGISGKIKAGNLWVVYLSDIEYGQTFTDAIALLKAESKEKRLVYKPTENGCDIEEVETYSLKKFDKGCVIINSSSDDGYIVSQFVNGKNAIDDKYWREAFLNVKSCQSPYQQTFAFVKLCDNFVKGKLSTLDKKDKSLLFSKIKTLLKDTDRISIIDFANSTFKNEEAEDFLSYFRTQNKSLNLPDEISIEPQKIQTKNAFTSQTIHLDNNFDITIYGGEGFLIHGVDSVNGMNFYKLFYKEEH